MIPGNANPLLLASAAQAGGYTIERSLRFASADSAYLSRTPASAGNRKTWTLSFWVKRGASTGSDIGLFSTYAGTNPATACAFNSNDGLTFYNYSGSYQFQLITTQVFRDYSAWYHLAFVVDTTQATASDRVKLYVNRVRVTTFSTETYPFQNVDTDWNSTTEHQIGNHASYFSGYLADIHFIDGQALDPTSFGEFDGNGIWQPKAYSGSYGTNGFHLDFSDNATAASLGDDSSGNGNDWTVNNLSVDSVGFSNTIASSQVWSNYLSPSASGWQYVGRDAPAAFDNDVSTFAYVNSSSSSEYIDFSFPSGISGHGGFVWLCGGNGNGQGLDNMTITINGSTTSSVARTGTSWDNWFKFPVSGTLGSFRIIGPYPVLRAISFWTDYSALVVDSQAITYGAPTFRDGDSLVDVPTNGTETDTGVGGEVRGNYCTWNPLSRKGNTVLSNGNLDVDSSSAGHGHCGGTIAVASGKWYWEITKNTNTASTAIGLGAAQASLIPNPTSTYITDGAGKNYIYLQFTNVYMFDGVNSTIAASSSVTTNSGTFMFALDMDNSKFWVGKDGTWFQYGALSGGDPAAGSNPVFTEITSGTPYLPIVNSYNDGNSLSANFGQRPFVYTAPSGFKALCTANLPAPVVTKPSDVFDVKLYTGNGSTQTISGLNFSPDLVWGKIRSTTGDHHVVDSVRGDASGTSNKTLFPNTTDSELSSLNRLYNFSSSGFTASGVLNTNAATYAAWTWDAGSSTVTNTDGSITSQVRANPSAGFSIVTWTYGSSTATIGHGLGAAPGFILAKTRSVSYPWIVYHSALGADKYMFLDSGAAYTNVPGVFSDNSSTVFEANSGVFTASATYVAYCFAPVKSYSAFGSYIGNGSAEGPFVYTGFRPQFVVIKRTDGSGNWLMLDSERLGYNGGNGELQANLADAEGTYNYIDILSNGFKVRGTDASGNASSGNYVYFAIAESPFQYARAR